MREAVKQLSWPGAAVVFSFAFLPQTGATSDVGDR